MQDLKALRENLLLNTADCALIAVLAADPVKRVIFRRLSAQLKKLVADIDAELAAGGAKDAA